MKVLPYLSEHMDRGVVEHTFTAAWGNTIWIEAKYASLIEKDGMLFTRPAYLRPKRTAIAIFSLLHEYCHTLQKEYQGEVSELQANAYAAKNFRGWCFRLGYSDRLVHRLWRSLPDHYQKPLSI